MILDRNPDAVIYIMYRDVRAYGFREELYQEARSRGVRFIRYDVDDKPVVENGPNGQVRITVKDHVLHRPLQIDADGADGGRIDLKALERIRAEPCFDEGHAASILLKRSASQSPMKLCTGSMLSAPQCSTPPSRAVKILSSRSGLLIA